MLSTHLSSGSDLLNDSWPIILVGKVLQKQWMYICKVKEDKFFRIRDTQIVPLSDGTDGMRWYRTENE